MTTSVQEKPKSIFRDWFFRQRAEEQAAKVQTRMQIAQRVAAGEDVPHEEILAVLDPTVSYSVVCPRDAQHTDIHSRAIANNRGMNHTCKTCGHEWTATTTESVPGIDAFDRDVAALRRIPVLKKQIAEVAGSEAKLAEIEGLRRNATDATREAMEAERKLFASTQEQYSQLEGAIRAGASYQDELNKLLRHINPSKQASLVELQRKRGRVILQEQELRKDLFGASSPGRLTDPFCDSLGSRWLTQIRKWFPFQEGEILDLDAIDPMKRMPVDKRTGRSILFSARYPGIEAQFGIYKTMWIREIQPALETLERYKREIAELATRIESLESEILAG